MSDMAATPERESSARMLAGNDFAAQGRDGKLAEGDVDWLKLTRSAYDTSTDWLQPLRKQWERATDHFNGKHASGSKYHSDAYKVRSRLFRPKTRELMRRAEAATAAAFFSTKDVMSIEAVDEFDEIQRLAAKVAQELVQYRLTKTIPWFPICIGASQDARNYGVCISKQWWEYEEGEDGEIAIDAPHMDLIAVENFRVDPAASWVDPVGTSPYVVEIMPMFVGDVKMRMKAPDAKTGAPAWKTLTDKEIEQASRPEDISIRQSRNKRQRADAREARSQPIGDFEMVNVHANIIRREGVDWLIYTLGTIALLSEPQKLREAYPWLRRRERPYTMGVGMIETHKTYPFSQNDMVSDVQIELNDLTNLRMDQRRLAIIGRYFAKQGAQVDVQALQRGTPGSVVFFNDPINDVRWDRAPDAPASADGEEDRLNVAFDGVAGNVSQGSVMSNRKLNETVGGMTMLSNSANMVLEYDLRVFAETWAEKALAQLARMEQAMETDETVLAIAGRKAGIYEQYVGGLPPEVLQGELTVSINVGVGATDPNMKVQKFAQAMGMLGQALQAFVPIYGPQVVQSKGFQEIASEAFGLLGYKDAQRFLDFQGQAPDPQMQAAVQQLQQQLQQMQAALQQAEMEKQAGIEHEKARAQGQIAVEQAKGAVDIQVEQAKHQLKQADMMTQRAHGVDDREVGAERDDAREARSAQREDMAAAREMAAQQQGAV